MFIGISLATMLGILAVWSCTMEDGARCQLPGDCASGICCKKPIGCAPDPNCSGVCTATQAICDDMFGTDGGADADTPLDDAAVEADAEAEVEGGEEAEAEAEVESGEEAEAEAEVETEAVEEADTSLDVDEDAPTDSAAETDL
jgi:hypothetical protein